ncbi:hypothetical protein V6N11_024776 [Hibiscus sabdariffa]|uniref:Integrase catalytic domain-containing protein n=1 Tax=Hibiscus sabdariffa TaxID=183260 RepID=A0ABR2QN46_9ROSI
MKEYVIKEHVPKEHVPKEPVPKEPGTNASRANKHKFKKHMDDILDVGCLVLATMTPELQKQHEYMVEYEMIQNPKEILKGKHDNRDRVREYLSLDKLLKECGIVSQLTPPDTPLWNGVYERRNRTFLDMVRSMMSHNNLPTSFWGHALEASAFTLDHVPSKSIQKTPHEMWTGKHPGMSFLKVWGCKAYIEHQMSTKLEPKSHKCTFVGYPKETKGYYFFNPKENKVFVARTGVFLEKEFLSNNGNSKNIELKEVQQQQVNEP